MATRGTPTEGVDEVIAAAYNAATLYLVLYTNGFNQFDRDTVLADITQPSNLDSESDPNGYGAIELTGTWTGSGAVLNYDHGGGTDPQFVNTGNFEQWEICYGAAVVTAAKCLHFKDFTQSRALDVGQVLKIPLRNIVP